MSLQIKFGTDGWRGVIAEDYTFDNVRRCAQGFARYLLALGRHGEWVIVGHDRRFASERFAAACAEVLAANGLHVWLTDGPTPTPVIAYAVLDEQAAGAINITASHNPPADNGFKVRDHRGGAIDPAGLQQIESLIPADLSGVKRLAYTEAEAQGRIRKFDAAPAYIEHLKHLIDWETIKQAGLKVVVDPMWGNGSGWFPHLLAGGKTQIVEIHDARNPIFPGMRRPEPIQPNVDAGLAKTVEVGADVCIITDGDADRLGVGDEQGRFIDQLRVFGLLALYLLDVRSQRGAIVKALSTTSMLDKLGRLYQTPVYTTGVGFKYVAPKMIETDAMIGGEESGGYAFRKHVPERDGILAGLFVLDMMVRLNKKPSQLIDLLFDKVGEHYYDRLDTTFPQEQRAQIQQRILSATPTELAGLKVEGLDTTDGYKFLLEDGNWLLIRFSGTEPIMRFYAETTRADKVQPILEAGMNLAGLLR
ncbi:MAG: phosphoglucomutase/phosphomannomutase family protein [Chloroflexi bacterium]|nr:phosphoglucomutase/phosphomannomutase family protein [Chloroflexota bacterium]